MKRILCFVLGAGVCALASPTAAENTAPADSQRQIEIAFRIVEMPAGDVKALFGKKGAAPGGDVTEDIEQRLGKLKAVDILSAPRVVTRPGQSAQIKIVQEQSFATSFRVVETNGAWEPVMKIVEQGISVTVVADTYPHDPERLRGSAEVTLSQLDSVSEQTVTPPGNQGPLKLQSPVVSSRVLTASFDMASGKTIVLGGLQRAGAGAEKSVVVLMRAEVLNSSDDLAAKLKGRVVRDKEFSQTPLGEVLAWLSAETKGAGLNFSVECDRVTKSDEKVSFQTSKGTEPLITLAARDMTLYDLIRHIAGSSGATLTFDRNTITLKLP